MLGRRDGRVVLRQLEDRILLPTRVAHYEARPNGSRQVGRGPKLPRASTRVNRQILPVTFEMQYLDNTAALKEVL